MVCDAKPSEHGRAKRQASQPGGALGVPPPLLEVPPSKPGTNHKIETRIVTKPNARVRCAEVGSAVCIRLGCDHGEISLKYTGFPRHQAVSIRSEISGTSGNGPVQASLASKPASGAHSGSADVNRAGSRPAAVNSAFESGGALLSFFVFVCSLCGGTARKCTRRPPGSSRKWIMPVTSCGGSDSLTTPSAPCVRRCRGLWRYQKKTTGGCPLANWARALAGS